jgi:hypothetical protein
MKKRQAERWGQFHEIIEQIKRISAEIGHSDFSSSDIALDQSDLSMRKLDELRKRLQVLQKEKVRDLKREHCEHHPISSCYPLGMCIFWAHMASVPFWKIKLSNFVNCEHGISLFFFSSLPAQYSSS